MSYIIDKIKKTVKNRFKTDENFIAEETLEGERGKHADSVIKNHVVWSMGAGFIPVPIADLFAVSAVQLDMVRQIARVYRKDFKESEGKALITAITGSSIARLGARAVKFIPGVGSVVGGVTMSVLSGASTYALGQVFKKHFETGGTFLDFDPKRVKKYYQEQFEKGKEVAKEMDKEAEDPTTVDELEDIAITETERIQKQLFELVALRNEGIIDEEEFQKLKSRILSGI